MPIQVPIAIAIAVDVPISSSVAKTCRPITDSTGAPSRKEWPQSPCRSRQAQSKYCINSGRFSPSCSLRRSRSSCVMPGSSPNCASGPPGSRFRTTNPMIETIRSRMRLCESRLSRKPRIQLSSFKTAPMIGRRREAAAAHVCQPFQCHPAACQDATRALEFASKPSSPSLRPNTLV